MNISLRVSICILTLLQFVIIPVTRTADILIFHNVASYSHRVATWPLAEALSNRGHKVTYISPFHPKEPNPNITEIVAVQHADYVNEFLNSEFDINLRVRNEMEPLLNTVFDFGFDACEALLSSPEFKNWLAENHKFDLVIIDNCFAECGVGLAHKLHAKHIIFSTVAALAYEYDAFGYQPESSSVPELELGPPVTPMSFTERLSNALISLRWRLAHFLYSLKIDHFIRNALKVPNMPYIGDLISRTSLVFYTGDVISDYPRALPPNHINIAGIHCKESSKALPEDISNFLKGNETDLSDGFVYLSLGSLVVSSNLPENIKQTFFDAIKSFPNLKFLWKWNGDFPEEIPENLFLRKWYPQIDVLGHPKIRAFITQSGRPSTLEALFNGVPMISIPILGDQDYNSNRLVEAGATIKLEIGTITVEDLKNAIKQAVYDPRTKSRMKKLQRIFRDRPMSPVDTAVWWSEYVLRTEDTLHMRPAGVNQNWFVRRQIDVWAFLSIGSFITVLGCLTAIFKLSIKVFKTKGDFKLKKA